MEIENATVPLHHATKQKNKSIKLWALKKMKKNFVVRTAWPIILLSESFSAIRATLQTSNLHHHHSRRRVHNMCRVNQHHNHCRPLMAFNSQYRGHFSTFQHGSGKQLRKQTFLNSDKGRNAQDKTIQITPSPREQIEKTNNNIIISKLSSNTETITSSRKVQGRATLLLVAFLYGTLNVALRAIYASDGAPAASVLSLVRQCLSVLTFIPIIVSVNRNKNGCYMTASLLQIATTMHIRRPIWCK